MKRVLVVLLAIGCSGRPPGIELPDGGEQEIDAGAPDAGAADSGLSDGGLSDGGLSDGGLTDGGLSDGGLTDGGLSDGGLSDGGLSDGGLTDGGLTDGGFTDGGLSDGGLTDGGLSDGGLTDAGTTDGGLPDAGAPDAGPPFLIEGFGAGTLGGWQTGSSSFLVTNLNDDGPGSLREACRTLGAPRVVTFALDGRIALLTPIKLPSNISLDGTGHDIGVSGKGFHVHGESHVILTHFAIEGVGPNSEDGIQIGFPNLPPSHHVVLDHVRFAQTGSGGDSANVDEAVSVIFGAHSITIAWCRFVNWEKAILAGNGDADASIDGNISLTVHHNLFDNTGRRHPRARYGRFDVFNNFLYRWHAFDWFYLPPYRDSYGSWCQNDCQMRLENNVYERISGVKDVGTKADDASRCDLGGRIAESGRFVTAASTAPLQFSAGCPAGATVFARPYPATIEPADALLGAKLFSQTGN